MESSTEPTKDIEQISKIQQETADNWQQKFEAGELDKPTGELSSKVVLGCLDENESGDAKIYIRQNKDRFVFDHAGGRSYVLDEASQNWKMDTTNEWLKRFDDVARAYAIEAKRQGWKKVSATKQGQENKAKAAEAIEETLLKRVKAMRTLWRRKNTFQLAVAGAGSLGISGDDWDLNPYLLGCRNGTIELRTGELRGGDPKDYIKSIAPTEYLGSDEPCPTFTDFLNSTFNNDTGLISFVQRMLGSALLGKAVDHSFFIMWGRGRNGKGTLLQAVADVLGPLLSGPIPAEMLLQQDRTRSSQAPSADLMFLQGRLVVWASETDEGRKLNPGRTKWLTGGDFITARPPYGKRNITFPAKHTLLLLTNHKPEADPRDFALWERIYLIPFTLSFIDNPVRDNERDKDPEMPGKLQAEASGILAWLVRGFLQWQNQGLNPPKTVLVATKDYQESQDHVAQFLAECVSDDAKAEIQAGLLQKTYKDWCAENNYEVESGNRFASKLLEKYKRDDSRRNRFYLGLKLKPYKASNDPVVCMKFKRTFKCDAAVAKKYRGEKDEDCEKCKFHK